ncbi:hypothetical protein [Mucilaginibacter sp.]
MAISVVIWVIVFATLTISREDRFSLSTIFTGAILGVILYLNRYDVKHLNLTEENIEVEYFDQGKFFTREDATYSKSIIAVLETNDKFVLLKNSKKIATIRRKATDTDDWGILKGYFAQSVVNI